MKNKKLICLFMVALMAALTIPAFATAGNTLGLEPSAQADTSLSLMPLGEAVVDVSVPTTGKLYINPLRFPVHYEYDGEEFTDNSQILTEPNYIENRGENPVRVSVSLTSTVQGGEMTLSSSPTKSLVTTSKKAFVYFEIKAVSNPSTVTWDQEYDSTKHVYANATSTKTKKNIVDLDDANGVNCFGAFRLTGDCIAKPKKPWTVADGLQVLVAFTFKPIITVS